MSAASVRILFVGTSTASTQSTLKELARSGWESHAVESLQEADSVLRTIRFELILATEKLSDGTGYGLVSVVERQGGNLFICVPLSETCLWLPAVEHGTRSLGQRALNPVMFATEARNILRVPGAGTDRPGTDRRGKEQTYRGFSSDEVALAKNAAANAVAQAADAEPISRSVGERFQQREDAAPKRATPPRRQTTSTATSPVASAVAVHPAPLAREEVVRELAGVAKRWRGF
jgi:hypothetical protein